MKTESAPEKQAGALATVTRHEFGATEMKATAETSMAAVAARERAIIEAEYIMAERHPRNWLDVRAAMLDHCSRPRFADTTRYRRKVGSKLVNGEWVDEIARGFTVRFAETLAQEMRNVKPFTLVTFEDELIRIVRFGVVDLERNLPRSREVAVAKTVERRGKKKGDEWQPPEGREVVAARFNSEGLPVYTVKATVDEIRSKVNAEEARTQRDFILRLCPRDILEDCEDKVYAVLGAEDKRDPKAAVKRLLDKFSQFSLKPSDLETYIGKREKEWTEEDIRELRELGAAIRDGQTTFEAALKLKHAPPQDDGEESKEAHDARLRQQMNQQAAQGKLAEEKIAALQSEIPEVTEFPDAVEGPERVRHEGKVYVRNEKRTGYVPEPAQIEALSSEAGPEAQPAQPAPRRDKPKFGQRSTA